MKKIVEEIKKAVERAMNELNRTGSKRVRVTDLKIEDYLYSGYLHKIKGVILICEFGDSRRITNTEKIVIENLIKAIKNNQN